MAKKLITLLFAFSGLFATAQETGNNLGIIPAPVSVKKTPGNFVLTANTQVKSELKNDKSVLFLTNYLKSDWGLKVAAGNRALGTTIYLTSKGAETLPAEGYKLTVTPKTITIIGKDAGLFYGVQTLIQLLPPQKSSSAVIPCAEIEDAPRFSYRGMHLDVSRHFFSVAVVKQFIDLMASYKLNNFHWHLTDDNGWRIEIKKYPKLTQVGGMRAQTTIGHYWDRKPQWYDQTPYGGYYTQDQIRDVVKYAAARYVNIVPEIEMPGHSSAALAAYPELSCDTSQHYKVAETFGIWTSVYCPNEQTFTFLENVLTEVMELFPSKMIHIGGDETPKDAWKKSAYVQQFIKDHNLKDEHGLQSYFIQRIEKFVNSKGRTIIGWDEILEGGLAPNAAVMSWQGEAGGIAAARLKHNVVMASARNGLYLGDRPTSRTDIESLRSNATLQKLYNYNPVPAVLNADEAQYIKGATGAIWSEYITTGARVDYTLLPRMLAIAELTWTPVKNKNYEDFAENRLPRNLARLDAEGINYRVPVAIGAKDTLMQGSQFRIALRPSVEGATIHYTIDGYPASETDFAYTKPLVFNIPEGQQRELQTVVVTRGNNKSNVTRTVMYNRPQPENNSFSNANALEYDLYKGSFTNVAAMDKAESVKNDTVSNFSIKAIGDTLKNFGIVYEGYINLPLDGTYTFSVASDGPAQVYVDDKLIADNDGTHELLERSGTVTTLRGLKKIRVMYASGGKNKFNVYVTAPDRPKAELSTMSFSTFWIGKGKTGIDAQ